MLRVRESEKRAFYVEAFKDFEDRMVTHLGKFFPAYTEPLGDDAVRRLIRYGVERAAKYGIVAERDVCLYIDAMFAYGRDFDEDPSVPWAAAILKDPSMQSPKYRMSRLVDAAFEHLDEARGIKLSEAELW